MPPIHQADTTVPPPEGSTLSRIYQAPALPALDSYVAFATALGIASAGYWPPPDAALKEVEADLRTLRETFNDYRGASAAYKAGIVHFSLPLR